MLRLTGEWIAFVLGAVFVAIAVGSLLSGPNVLAILFLAVGVFFLVRASVHYVRLGAARMRVAAPEVDVPSASLHVGQQFSVNYRQMCKHLIEAGRVRFSLVVRETAEYTTSDSQGRTQTSTATHDATVQEFVLAERRFDSGETISESCTLCIPADGMHTFIADNNSIKWYITVCVEMGRWPDYRWEHEVTVSPELLGATDA
jgi:hypothetical protein